MASGLLEKGRMSGPMPTPCLRSAARILALLIATAWATSGPLGAQQLRVFGEERRITAVDLAVAFEAGGLREWAADGLVPKTLRPEDFEILYDGEKRPVIAVDTAPGQWQTTIYFDAVLARTAELKWAATSLADAIDALLALGEVSIVIADPEPRVLLSSTRDVDHVHAVLSQVAQTAEGIDELVALRTEVLAELGRDDPDLDPEMLHEVAAGEVRRVRQRQDDLLLALVDGAMASPAAASPLRALILAGGGFDLRPAAFYQPLISELAESTTDASDAVPDPGEALVPATDDLARTLAAYGWVSLHLAPPRPQPLKEGKRIGKLRLSGPGIVFDENENRTFFKLFGATFEEHRKPRRAEAYLELGAALQGQGKLAEAEDALRQAIYYFSGDPRTADQQAEAYARLGRVLASRDKRQEAAAALALARQLDPGRAGDANAPEATLLDPSEPQREIARVTTGGLVQSPSRLRDLLGELGRRVRLTYQVAGSPDGELHALQATYIGPARRSLKHPGWARSATPPAVAAARARRLLTLGETTDGELPLSARLDPQARFEVRTAVELRVGEPTARGLDSADERTASWRITLGFGGPDSEPLIEHRRLDPVRLAPAEAWTHRVEVERPQESSWLTVVVEDLETGSWGGRLIELP